MQKKTPTKLIPTAHHPIHGLVIDVAVQISDLKKKGWLFWSGKVWQIFLLRVVLGNREIYHVLQQDILFYT